MYKLNKYVDINGVTFYLNPLHIVSAVVNREGHMHDWVATLTDTNKQTYTIRHPDFTRLQSIILNGLRDRDQ